MSINELATKKKIFGSIARVSRQEDGLTYILCSTCEKSNIFLDREVPFLLLKNNISTDTPVEKLLLDTCPECKPEETHTVFSK